MQEVLQLSRKFCSAIQEVLQLSRKSCIVVQEVLQLSRKSCIVYRKCYSYLGSPTLLYRKYYSYLGCPALLYRKLCRTILEVFQHIGSPIQSFLQCCAICQEHFATSNPNPQCNLTLTLHERDRLRHRKYTRSPARDLCILRSHSV